MEDLVLARLREFDEKRKCSPVLLGLGSILIEFLEVDAGSTISDLRKNNRFEHMCHLPTIMVESRNTTLPVITYHLVEPGFLLGDCHTLPQIDGFGNLGQQERA